MGRFAAIVWALAGAFVLVAALAEIPTRNGEISRGYGVRDARMILVGATIGMVASALAFVGGWRAWLGRSSAWFALAAMVLAVGGLVFGIITGHPERALGYVPLLASPYGVWLLPMALVPGGLATLAVALVDRATSSR